MQAFVFVKNRMLRFSAKALQTSTHGRSKVDNKVVPLVFIGYDGDTAAYQLLDPASRKIVLSFDARLVDTTSRSASRRPLRPGRRSRLPHPPSTFISPGVVAADPPEPHTPAPPAAARAVPPAPARAQSEVLFRTPPTAHPHPKCVAAPPPSPDLLDPIDFLDDPFGATLAQVEAIFAGTGESLSAADDDFALPLSDPRKQEEAARNDDSDR
ncbi:hypothetical protein JCM3770_000470 [Rhodotorula araucariae]